MLNLLIVDDNLRYVKSFVNYIIGQTQNIKIVSIATDGEEAIDMILKKDIDLITLDLKLPKCSGTQVIERISHMQKKPQIIVVSGEIELINQVRHNDMIVDIVNKGEDIVTIYKKIEKIAECKTIKEQRSNIERKVMNELLYIGFNPKHKGTRYMLEAIVYIYEQNNNRLLEQLERNVYKMIACMYNKSEKNIKDNIMNATECMYAETKSDILKMYFLNNINNVERKPTPKIVISTVLGKI